MTTRTQTRTIAPAVNIYESTEGVTIEADLPGVKADAVSVEVCDGHLLLRGHRNGADETGTVRYTERVRGDFYRSFRLADTLDPDKVEAKLQDGVLRVTLERREQKKPRQISIN